MDGGAGGSKRKREATPDENCCCGICLEVRPAYPAPCSHTTVPRSQCATTLRARGCSWAGHSECKNELVRVS